MKQSVLLLLLTREKMKRKENKMSNFIWGEWVFCVWSNTSWTHVYIQFIYKRIKHLIFHRVETDSGSLLLVSSSPRFLVSSSRCRWPAVMVTPRPCPTRTTSRRPTTVWRGYYLKTTSHCRMMDPTNLIWRLWRLLHPWMLWIKTNNPRHPLF